MDTGSRIARRPRRVRAHIIATCAALAVASPALFGWSNHDALAHDSVVAVTTTAGVLPRSVLPPPAVAPVAVATATATRVAAVEVAPPANRSSCTTTAPGAVMTIVISSISYACPVYPGGQAMLNSGAVTLVTDRPASDLFATLPGAAGTLWIAGHRTSHGGAFAAVPDLAAGALVTVSDGTTTATYRIVGRVRVEVLGGKVVDSSGAPSSAATVDSVLRPDRGGDMAPRLVLQTCDGASFRWMIYGDLVAP